MAWEEHFLPAGKNKIHIWRIPSKTRLPFGSLIHFHGNAQNMSAHFLFSFWIHYFGFDLILFDYSGYGKSEGSPSRQQSILDGLAVTRWASEDLEDSRPLFILGQSLGGAIAVSVLTSEGSRFKDSNPVQAMVLDSTFASYRSLARKKLSEFWLTWPLQFPLSFLISDNFSPADSMEKLNIPVLAFHSNQDPVVPFGEGMSLYKGLGKPPQIEILEKQGHTLALAVKDTVWREKLIKFLCEHTQSRQSCLGHLSENLRYLDLKTAFDAD